MQTRFKLSHLTTSIAGLVRLRKEHHGVDLMSDALPFGRLWYGKPNAIRNPIDSAKFHSRSHRAVVRVCDQAEKVIDTYRGNRGKRFTHD
jgi:hypothetical protein